MSFKDHFSGHAVDYSKYRPSYPPELFTYLSSITENHSWAWDCATGSGQAAIGLTPFFDKVFASDASAEQIKNAQPNDKVEYLVASAEHSTLDDSSIDLITVAQAAHWFNHPAFYKEVRRVAKPGATIAVWSYSNILVNEAIDEISDEFYNKITRPYWPAERHYIDDRYETLPFPFKNIPTPTFKIQYRWAWKDMKNYLLTWSATQRYIKANGTSPIDLIETRMKALWTGTLDVRWPIYLLAGLR